jgi:hypothetical protein
MRVRGGGRRASAPSSSDALSDQKFHRLSDAELQRLGSDDLVSYIPEATDAGRSDCAQAGLASLCWRHYDGEASRLGRIRTGYPGDLTVLAQDPVEISPDDVIETPVLLTVVDGEMVFRAATLDEAGALA